ncbi:WxL protein peptidoglycan domain-containing protein [Paenibacillus sp. Y412MC10]|uniref:WxL protein peptidoglycan domain-containing protein n=1 Tax=Geobacillus sp. (strain Y412MC10) TaxID=481743 RepID=UPI0011AB5B56|nr:DUF916 domain-containing protein [Paenibacillus sp. Y412MC10]
MRFTFLKTAILAVAILAITGVQNVLADGWNLSMSITDKQAETLAGSFHSHVKPGTAQTYTVTVRNSDSKKASTFYLYPTDVIPALNGGIGFKYYGEEVTGPGKWVDVQPQKVTLKPNDSRNITFQVKIPENVKYGQYISYIALQEFKGDAIVQDVGNSSLSTDITTKIGIQIISDYKSDLAKSVLSFSRLDHQYLANGLLRLSSFVKNDGTILARPDVSIEVFDQDKNERVFGSSMKMGSVYGSTEAEGGFLITDKFLPAGNYKVLLKGQWNDQVFSKTFYFTLNKSDISKAQQSLVDQSMVTVVNHTSTWPLIVICILAIVIIFLLFFIILKRRSKKKDAERGGRHVKKNSGNLTLN